MQAHGKQTWRSILYGFQVTVKIIPSCTAQHAEAGQAARSQGLVNEHNEETCLLSLLQLIRCLLSWHGLCWRLEM